MSLDAGNSFLRRLAMKVGVCIENLKPARRKQVLDINLKEQQDAGILIGETNSNRILEMLLEGDFKNILLTHTMLREVINGCEVINGKKTGYP